MLHAQASGLLQGTLVGLRHLRHLRVAAARVRTCRLLLRLRLWLRDPVKLALVDRFCRYCGRKAHWVPQQHLRPRLRSWPPVRRGRGTPQPALASPRNISTADRGRWLVHW
jgi:hypothetical protein